MKLAHAGRDAALRGLQDRKERRRLKRRRGPTPEEVAKEKRRRASQDAAARGGAGRGGAVRPASQNGGVTARDPAAARRDPAQTQKPSKRQLTLADLDARLGLGTTAEEDDAAEAELARKLGGSGPKSRRKEREEEEEDVLAQLGLGGKRSAMQREVDREVRVTVAGCARGVRCILPLSGHTLRFLWLPQLGGSDEDDGSLDIFGEGGEGSESDGGSEGAADGASEGTSGDASNDEDEMGSGSLSMDGDGSDEESSDSEGEEGRAARGGEAGPSREGRYVPPAQRGAGAGRVGDLERRVRGLCNKLSVVNVKGIAEEVLVRATRGVCLWHGCGVLRLSWSRQYCNTLVEPCHTLACRPWYPLPPSRRIPWPSCRVSSCRPWRRGPRRRTSSPVRRRGWWRQWQRCGGTRGSCRLSWAKWQHG